METLHLRQGEAFERREARGLGTRERESIRLDALSVPNILQPMSPPNPATRPF